MRHVALKTVSSINRSGAGMIRARAAKKIEDLKFENSTLKKLAVVRHQRPPTHLPAARCAIT